MRKIISLCMVLVVGGVAWGEVLSTTPSTVHRKEKSKKPVAAMAPIAVSTATSAPVSTGPVVTPAAAIQAVKGLIAPLPVPVALSQAEDLLTALDGIKTSGAPQDGGAPPATLRGVLRDLVWKPGLFDDTRFSAGMQMLKVGSTTDVAPAVGLRLRPPKSPWSFEVGSALPHTVSGNFQQVQQSVGNVNYDARVQNLWETHIAANYAFAIGDQHWVQPEASFGVSMIHMTDQVHTLTLNTFQYLGQTYNYTTSQTYQADRYAWSPLFRLGVVLFPGRLVSLDCNAAYVGYGNTVTAAGETFDLGFSGWMLGTALRVRL